ncbi:hypothetical protein ACFRKB_30540 [Streptomyces scopuliridis]|uniref:hypothetical protein n=1 Tax=Streptomyces scopuliridis TaxID=452529 RepID=UPI00367AA424
MAPLAEWRRHHAAGEAGLVPATPSSAAMADMCRTERTTGRVASSTSGAAYAFAPENLETEISMSKVWFVTGSSRGLGTATPSCRCPLT